MTDAPPSRYKVVERGRRLIVIDARTGQPATHERTSAPPSFPPAPVGAAVEATTSRTIDDRSGAAILHTTRLYDLKGPRKIVMTEDFSSRLGRAIGGWLIALFIFAAVATIFFPLLWLVPLVVLLQPKARAAFRMWMTARLDEADQAAS